MSDSERKSEKRLTFGGSKVIAGIKRRYEGARERNETKRRE